jgi:hypothetical protein
LLLLHDHFTIAPRSLYSRYVITKQLQCNCFSFPLQSLLSSFAITSQFLCNHFANCFAITLQIALQSLCKLLCNHFANCFAITSQFLCNHFANCFAFFLLLFFGLQLPYCCTIALQSLFDRRFDSCIPLILSFEIPPRRRR